MVRVGIKLLMITALVFFGTRLWYGQLENKMLKDVQVMNEPQPSPQISVTKDLRPAAPDYQIIISRNIFQAALDDNKPVENKKIISELLEPTSLKLSLEGTVSGSSHDARAIITDNKKNHQDMYRIGDSLQGAEIKSIERGKVILLVNGRQEVLSLKERKGGRRNGSKFSYPLKPKVIPREPDFVRQPRKVKIVRPRRPNRPLIPVPRKFNRVLPGQAPSSDFEETETGDEDVIMPDNQEISGKDSETEAGDDDNNMSDNQNVLEDGEISE